ncbi:hypothetical protein COV06_02265 [Candidatus Uhrbacteria bacterium CG10_big_fil_rev_8_21_14_0_10_50_16]|uniref:Uncharacterized protein n=1 Tax=Candidatus Uhrbacteria bacterium CG10_big_fil_rev_8_21_14_0_10_50_16 TaxID=1975039 RepID=A0A2H0RMM4_9BACT|nr:MAG: hypothetical protein COV06_02265 [Candidatus Uhrbacteria bacterium CG10_big_fil_rev_8_21_14_0_10_50_16]
MHSVPGAEASFEDKTNFVRKIDNARTSGEMASVEMFGGQVQEQLKSMSLEMLQRMITEFDDQMEVANDEEKDTLLELRDGVEALIKLKQGQDLELVLRPTAKGSIFELMHALEGQGTGNNTVDIVLELFASAADALALAKYPEAHKVQRRNETERTQAEIDVRRDELLQKKVS